MSRHRTAPVPPPARWSVIICDGSRIDVPPSSYRCRKNGDYEFTDASGVVAVFTPGNVISIERKPEPLPARREEAADGIMNCASGPGEGE